MAGVRGGKPTYPLATIKKLIEDRPQETVITTEATKQGFRLGFGRAEILKVVLELDAKDFEKTMPAKNAPGLFQDVYKPTVNTDRLYVKLQIGFSKKATVISFHLE